MKFKVEIPYKQVSSKGEFRENRSIDSRTLLKGVNKAPPYFKNFSADLGEFR
jgi:hypothetical protein